MKTTEVADKVRRIVEAEERGKFRDPINWNGLSCQTQDRWRNIANAAGAVLGVTLEED